MTQLTTRNAGFSLVSIMIAIGLMGIITSFIATAVRRNLSAARSVELRTDLDSIRRTINQRVSCTRTLEPFGPNPMATCSGPVAVRDHKNDVFIPDTGAAFGKWHVKAACETAAGQTSLIFRVAYPKAIPGTFLSDPLNANKRFDYESSASILWPAMTTPCSGSSGPAPHPGGFYIRHFVDEVELPHGAEVCCEAGDIALALGGTMAGAGANDSMMRSWRPNDRCIRFCEKACNGEIWSSVWLSCATPR